MKRSEISNSNTILKEKQQNYSHYHQAKLIDLNTVQVQKYYLLIKVKR